MKLPFPILIVYLIPETIYLFEFQAVNKIYGDTEFDAGGWTHAGHTFEVQRIKIYNNSDCTGNIQQQFSLLDINK